MRFEELDRARKRRDEMNQELSQVRSGPLTAGAAERIRNLETGITRADQEITRLEEQGRRAEAAFANGNTERGDGAGPGLASADRRRRLSGAHGETRDMALRAIEARSDVLSTSAGDRLAEIVEDDRAGVDSRYIRAIADPAYESAFLKALAFNGRGAAGGALEPDEGVALDRVGEAQIERSMSLGTAAAGGYAVPFALDPTIVNTSDGALNPMRSLATVTPITVDTWKGVNSEGVEAHFVPEGTEASDDSPTLTQPSIKAERAQAFVPFSIELSQDWPSLGRELANLFSEAKDELEAQKFSTGDGSDEPEGLFSGLDVGSLVDTTGAGAFAIGDVYKLQEALPPRFQPRARWIAANAIANAAYRFGGPGSSEPSVFNESRDRILGKPYDEVSTMSTALTTGSKILAYGDFKAGYRIVDRIGMSVEVVPHLLGPNRRPTGQRGLYAYWRVGGAVVVDNAIRALKIKAA